MVNTATSGVIGHKAGKNPRAKARALAGASVKHAAAKKSAATGRQAATVAPAQPVGAAQSGGRKQKPVRDSFTMPASDFALIHTLKERALSFRRPTKKSELLRAGLHALAALNDVKLRSVLDGLAPVKSGRPRKAN